MKLYKSLIQSIVIIFIKIILYNVKTSQESIIGVFEINSLDDIDCKPKQVNADTNEWHQICDFSMEKMPLGAGVFGFGKVGIPPYLNITNDCRDKLLKKNPYAKDVLIYKIFRFRESDPVKEANNQKLGVLHVYESFFQLFYYRNNGYDKYTKVDVKGVCGEKIGMFLMHTLDNETMLTNWKNVQVLTPIKAPVAMFLKWYDTLNPNSDFYNSICSGYTYNTLIDKFLKNETELHYYDTPLDVRKKYFFGNLYLCPDYCSYSGVFSVVGLYLVVCHCDDPHMDLLSNISEVPEKQYLQPFDYDEEDFYKSKDSFFSVGVFMCYMFTFILGFEANYGCYIVFGIASIIFFSYVELLVFGRKRILSVLELLYNNNVNPDMISYKRRKKSNNNNNSKEKILKNDNNNDLISDSVNNGKNNNKNVHIKNVNNIHNIKNKNMNNNLEKIHYNKRPKEKFENEEDEMDEIDYENLDKKEIKIFSNNIYNNHSQNHKKTEKIIKRIETNDEREEESEDSEKVQEENIDENQEYNINNENNENEEGQGQNANPPKIKIKMKRKTYKELRSNRLELSSNKKLVNRRVPDDISPIKIDFDNPNSIQKKSITLINRNSQISKMFSENEKRMVCEQEIKENIQKKEENPKLEKEINIADNIRKLKTKKSVRISLKDSKDQNILKIGSLMDTHGHLPFIPKSNMHITIDNIFTDQELNSMSFLQSLKYDKRTFYQMYLSLLNYQAPLFFLLHYYNSNPNENYTFQIKYPSAKLIYFCYEIYVCLFFNAVVFGTKSAGYQFFGTYTFWKHLGFAVVLFPFCLLINNFFHFILFYRIKKKIIEIKIWCFTKLIKDKKSVKDGFNYFLKKEVVSKYHRVFTKLEDIHPNDIERKVKHYKEELKKLITNFFKIYQKKINVAIGFTIFGILVMWYFIAGFCVVFKNSQGNYLLNVLLTFILSNLFPGAYCFLPAYVRQKALKEQNKTYFILSQFLRAF